MRRTLAVSAVARAYVRVIGQKPAALGRARVSKLLLVIFAFEPKKKKSDRREHDLLIAWVCRFLVVVFIDRSLGFFWGEIAAPFWHFFGGNLD